MLHKTVFRFHVTTLKSNVMLSSHQLNQYFTHLNCYCNHKSRTMMKISTTQLELQSRKRSRQNMLRVMIRSHFSAFSEHHFKLKQPESHAKDQTELDQDEEKYLQNGTGNSGNGEGTSDENITDGSGNGNINDNGNGNGNSRDDDGSEWNSEKFYGVEWWLWWKWQQVRHSHQNYDNIFDVWPVDTAVQVVTNGVKETIKPAVRAIVLGPLRQHITIQGFLLLLVFGAFVISFLQMFAGLAMVSTGISLAGVAALILGLIFRPWSSRGQSKSEDDDNDIAES